MLTNQNTMKRIILSRGKQSYLCRIFGTSRVTVWSALNYVTNSELAEKIRRAALAEGGIVECHISVPEGFMPNCQTDYVHGDDGRVQRVLQTFSNDVRVEFDNDRCTAIILRGDKPVKTYEAVAIRDWGNIVFEAQSLADSLNG